MRLIEIASQAELDALPENTIAVVRSGRFVAWGSAHVVAWGSAHVVAWESAHVEARASAHVEASQYVSVHQHSETVVVIGGTVIRVKRLVTITEWCAFYGVHINGNGHVLLYKAVRDDYRSDHATLYQPGTVVEASDWDGGRAECGGGLHFSPHPALALEFDPTATRFIACPVALADIRPPQESDEYPSKVKAKRLCAPVVEVDRNGNPV